MFTTFTPDFSTPAKSARTPVKALLSRSELKLLVLILATGIACVWAANARQQAVDWMGFLPLMQCGLELIVIGMLIRRTRHLGRTATAAIAFGLYFSFLVCFTILTLTAMPFCNPMVDHQLIAADALLGFNWVKGVATLAQYPAFALYLKLIYLSVIPQSAFIVVLLAFLGRKDGLSHFLMVGFLSFITTIFIWWLFPSVGPAAYGMVSADLQEKASLVANAHYGETMWRYATVGNEVISAPQIKGVVAFPSMHIVLTCMVLWFARGTIAFIPLLILNAAMPIATVLQGGHNIVDLFGGISVFYACVWGARAVLTPSAPVTE
ncbi:MAG: phosphatase PAP2 family protein [Cypionkella sp.]